MSKNSESKWTTDLITPVAGRDYVRQPNGVIVINRTCRDLVAPYAPEPVPDYLSLVDHTLAVGKKEYTKMLDAEEQKLNHLVRERLKPAGKFLVAVLQGRDGAGKTGSRKIAEEAIDNDPKIFKTVPIEAPTQEELAHPYLWRFFRYDNMPCFGQMRVFDRSWAERVLVERVEELTPVPDLQRSYAQLRAFEWGLVQQGAILVKVWLDITKDEQKRRFDERAKDKPWKLGASDKKARKQWPLYTPAANEMFHRTGTNFAPWHIIASEDKRYSRIAFLQLLNQAMIEQLS